MPITKRQHCAYLAHVVCLTQMSENVIQNKTTSDQLFKTQFDQIKSPGCHAQNYTVDSPTSSLHYPAGRAASQHPPRLADQSDNAPQRSAVTRSPLHHPTYNVYRINSLLQRGRSMPTSACDDNNDDGSHIVTRGRPQRH